MAGIALSLLIRAEKKTLTQDLIDIHRLLGHLITKKGTLASALSH
jgi:hypothetical protein